MVREKWERETGSSVGVWHLYGFIVTAFFQLCLFVTFPTYEHATDKIPWTADECGCFFFFFKEKQTKKKLIGTILVLF